MPVTKSAKRALRVSQRNHVYNLRIKNRLKKEVKIILSQLKSGKATGAKISQITSLIDKAVKNKVIHQNKAARLKSKISKAAAEKKIKLTKRERRIPVIKKKIAAKPTKPKKNKSMKIPSKTT